VRHAFARKNEAGEAITRDGALDMKVALSEWPICADAGDREPAAVAGQDPGLFEEHVMAQARATTSC